MTDLPAQRDPIDPAADLDDDCCYCRQPIAVHDRQDRYACHHRLADRRDPCAVELPQDPYRIGRDAPTYRCPSRDLQCPCAQHAALRRAAAAYAR